MENNAKTETDQLRIYPQLLLRDTPEAQQSLYGSVDIHLLAGKHCLMKNQTCKRAVLLKVRALILARKQSLEKVKAMEIDSNPYDIPESQWSVDDEIWPATYSM